MVSVLWVVLAFGQPGDSADGGEVAAEDRAVAAEARRIRGEVVFAAKNNRNEAVDRLYRQLIELGETIPDAIHTVAADASRSQGDLLTCMARLHRAGDTSALADVAGRFGTVRFSAPAGIVLEGEERFAPDEVAALAFVNGSLTTDGRTVAMLPAGTYEAAGRSLEVRAGTTVSLLLD